MNQDNLFIVLEHINEFKNNRYQTLRAKQLSQKDSNNISQLNLLERQEIQHDTLEERREFKIIN